MNNINIQYVEASTLKAADYNPRKWDKSAEDKLKQSIEQFGLVDPFLVNKAKGRENIIIGGHFRWQMAKDLGITEVPVVYLDIPDIEKEKELNLRLNRNTGEWDFELLKSFDIDLLLDIGFDDTDLSEIWDDALETDDDNFDTEKELEKAKETDIQTGDKFQLGKHTLLCGDSTKLKDVKNLVGSNKATMLYCDGPYNINLDYDKGVGKGKNYGGKKTNDSLSKSDYKKFIKTTVENALKVSSKDLHAFYWCDEKYIGTFQEIFEELGLTNRRVCLWIKNNQNTTPQIAFNKVYEPCVYATLNKPYLNTDCTKFNEIMNREIETGNRVTDDILDLFNIWLEKRLPSNEYNHPTEKPVTLHEKALRRCTKPNDTILELFGGSGSTLIACEQMKRKCLIMEIEPIFVQLIINRYENLTGNKAKKIN